MQQIDCGIATDISKFIYNELIKVTSLSNFDAADLLLREQLKEFKGGPRFLEYYESHVQGVLRNQLVSVLRIGFATGNWTNNNAESKNYIIKMIRSKFYFTKYLKYKIYLIKNR